MNKLSRNQWIAVAVAVIVVCYFLLYSLVGGMFTKNAGETQTIVPNTMMNDQTNNPADQNTSQAAPAQAATSTRTGPAAVAGATVTVNYTLKLANGQVVDTSIGRGPFSFVVGAGQVISGWDKGLVGAHAGQHLNLVIPPEQGYGALTPGQAKTHPLQGETLYFDIDVLKVQNP